MIKVLMSCIKVHMQNVSMEIICKGITFKVVLQLKKKNPQVSHNLNELLNLYIDKMIYTISPIFIKYI